MIICTDAANNRTDALRPEDTNDTDPTTWDEEMGGWAASSRTAASDDAQLSPPGPNKRSLGQLRAIQWPPRAPRVVAKNAWRYAKSVVKPLEIVFWALLLLFIHGFLGKHNFEPTCVSPGLVSRLVVQLGSSPKTIALLPTKPQSMAILSLIWLLIDMSWRKLFQAPLPSLSMFSYHLQCFGWWGTFWGLPETLMLPSAPTSWPWKSKYFW